MSARFRKLIGMVGILVFLMAYVVAAATLSDRVPKTWWVQVVYFSLAGVLWGVPLLPLIGWMNRGR
ncbi:MAG TPA: DUF2842 domain-containing protein [Phenylobacterium sp.]|uniref:DUF2842 domain-containing protein n=1 Tax=Phenylobacterium sp. TaxID=1871053 RepID=UPI002C2B4C51|nr:DUF2842 domain-containing protein [Phenylobacterium sp.]HSV03607.1 DUF2842 domain-containing protein [Phenylobacterium sp.]